MATTATHQSLRIDAGELKRRLDSGEQATILDTRGAAAARKNPSRLPGAIRVDPADPLPATVPWPPDRLSVAYCT